MKKIKKKSRKTKTKEKKKVKKKTKSTYKKVKKIKSKIKPKKINKNKKKIQNKRVSKKQNFKNFLVLDWIKNIDLHDRYIEPSLGYTSLKRSFFYYTNKT